MIQQISLKLRKQSQKSVLQTLSKFQGWGLLCVLCISVSFIAKGQVRLVKDINPDIFSGNLKGPIASLNGQLFLADGLNLWISDGTTTGTKVLKELSPGFGGGNPLDFSVMDGKLLFMTGSSSISNELWYTDGTEEGTKIMNHIVPDAELGKFSKAAATQNKVFFMIQKNQEVNLWVSDGTASGTQLVKKLSSSLATNFERVLAHNGKLYFQMDDGVHGHELWVSDGTEVGTHLLKDISVGSGNAYPKHFINFKGKVYFMANGALWMTDGTESGTQQVKNNVGTVRRRMKMSSNVLYFFVDDFSEQEVWMTDGTESGTQMVKKISVTDVTHLTDVTH